MPEEVGTMNDQTLAVHENGTGEPESVQVMRSLLEHPDPLVRVEAKLDTLLAIMQGIQGAVGGMLDGPMGGMLSALLTPVEPAE